MDHLLSNSLNDSSDTLKSIEVQLHSEYTKAAYILLNRYGKPLGARQLVEYALNERLLSDNLNAKTPWKTMHARLSVHIRRYGTDSRFIRVAPGIYDLRKGLDFGDYEAPKRKPPKPKEQVLVFPTSLLEKMDRFQGINQDWEPIYRQLINPSVCTYIDRIEAENSDEYKQIIAYVMVTSNSKILAFRRGNYNRVADFLRGCQCIGFGGHVSYSDLTAFDLDNMGIMNCAARELGEEIKLPPEDANALVNFNGIKIVGMLNDDSSDNGRRHLAIVLRYEVIDYSIWTDIKRREMSINQLRWLDLNNSSFSLWDFEYWSQLCLREYFPELINVQPSFKIIRKSALKPPHLLCVIGQLGSGKSRATEVLTNEFGYTEINSGRVLANLLGIPPVLEASRSAFQAKAWEFINSSDGPKKLAQAIWDEIKRLDVRRVLIDGIRQRSTFEQLKMLASKQTTGMLYVHTPPDVAYQFYRQRANSLSNIHDFLKLREAPVESEVAELIGLADAVLYNWKGSDMYHDAICRLMA